MSLNKNIQKPDTELGAPLVLPVVIRDGRTHHTDGLMVV